MFGDGSLRARFKNMVLYGTSHPKIFMRPNLYWLISKRMLDSLKTLIMIIFFFEVIVISIMLFVIGHTVLALSVSVLVLFIVIYFSHS